MNVLFDFVVGCGLGLFGVAETWLLPDVPDSFVALSGYALVRCDTTSGVRKHGVGLYIKSDIKFRFLDEGCANVCCVHLVDFDVFVAMVYRPPSNGSDENTSICDFLYSFCDSREVLVLGDFNLPSVPWNDDNFLGTDLPPLQRGFVDCFFSLGLTQWVMSPTFVHSDNILDLVLTSEKDRLGDVVVHPPFPGCGHCPLTFSYYFMNPMVLGSTVDVRRAWHRGNYGQIERALVGVDWDYEFFGLTLDEMVSKLNSVLFPLISLYVPIWEPRPQRVKFRTPSDLVRARRLSWTNYKEVRSRYGRRSREAADALANYQEINVSYRNFYGRSVVAYEQSLARDLKQNSKLFHKYIRSKKVGNPSVGPLRVGTEFTRLF